MWVRGLKLSLEHSPLVAFESGSHPMWVRGLKLSHRCYKL